MKTDRSEPVAPVGVASGPGGISLTHLTVYDADSLDGLAGGSPHVHLACAEAYYVLRGSGAVELVSLRDGYRRVDLLAGKAILFEPGVVHRLVNGDSLEILVLMQNAGLPERGDAVFTFPPSDLADPAAYAEHAKIGDLAGAMARRDRAVQGLALLKEGYAESFTSGTALLAAFHRAAASLVQHAVDDWRAIVRNGPQAAVECTLDRLDALASGMPLELEEARVVELTEADERLGMCGRLLPLLGAGEQRLVAPA
jgi:mannose-6-phosphate isomerase-like protein (cupin superfamily)